MTKKQGLKLDVSVTDTELFQSLLKEIFWMFKHLPKRKKLVAYKRIKNVLGEDYDLSGMKE